MALQLEATFCPVPDVAVLGLNPFCVSALEQNDIFLTQLFGIRDGQQAAGRTPATTGKNVAGKSNFEQRMTRALPFELIAVIEI